jgi:EAL domain-containing protein (putative c-di-GMP-specific phosphodiesterase class I)
MESPRRAPAGPDRDRVTVTGNELVRAVGRDELELHFQPVIELGTGQLTGFEALVRWHHPRHGFLAPDRFIPVAEECGLIELVDDWVLRDAARRLAAWQEDALVGRGFRVHVNVTGAEFDGDLVERVERAVHHSGAQPDGLTVEVTETRLIDDVDVAKRTIDALHGMGVAVAIDDFGAEYATFVRLHALRFDTIKIDKGFIAVCDSDFGAAFIQAFVDLARGLGAGTVAEGIETCAQLEALARVGCHHGQGFLWSPAIPASDAEHLLVTGELPTDVTRAGVARLPRLLIGPGLRTTALVGPPGVT